MIKEGIKILIVDDDYEIADIIKTHLNWKGFKHIDTCKSAREAISLIEKNKYTLVLSDVKMPEMSGVELLKRIKVTQPEAIVIMITGQSNLSDVVHCQIYGALDFIFKPFGNFSELDAVMDRAVELHTRWTTIINKVKGVDIFGS